MRKSFISVSTLIFVLVVAYQGIAQSATVIYDPFYTYYPIGIVGLRVDLVGGTEYYNVDFLYKSDYAQVGDVRLDFDIAVDARAASVAINTALNTEIGGAPPTIEYTDDPLRCKEWYYVPFMVDNGYLHYYGSAYGQEAPYNTWTIRSLSGAEYGYDNNITNINTIRPYYAVFNPVPIPGAVWLLGPGLIGLVGIRRKIKN